MWNAAYFIGGLVLLLIGGKLLVGASIDAARRLGVSPLIVGLTLVAWGTSAPELALNITSAIKGRAELAVGNVVGANICNMTLVLGVCAMMRPLAVQERLIRVEIWLNAAILVFMAAMGLTHGFQRWEPGAMLFVFGLYSMWTIMAALRKTEAAPSPELANTLGDDPTQPPPPMGWFLIGACFAGGLALLSFGGSLASDGAAGIAIAFGVPPAVVGATVVSIGTTLPELITGVLAVRRGQTDLAMGNAIGSCLFNAGAIFGLCGLITPPPTDATLTMPLVFMGVLSIALIPIALSFGRTVSRGEGVLLLVAYAVFLALSGWKAAS